MGGKKEGRGEEAGGGTEGQTHNCITASPGGRLRAFDSIQDCEVLYEQEESATRRRQLFNDLARVIISLMEPSSAHRPRINNGRDMIIMY